MTPNPPISAPRLPRRLPGPYLAANGVAGLALAAVGLAAWLFLPVASSAAEDLAPGVRVCLVDTSASARRCRAASWMPWVRSALRAEAAAAEEAEEELAVVVFAAGAQRRFGPGDPTVFQAALLGRGVAPFDPLTEVTDDGASDLAGALRAAASLALGPGRRPGEVVLLGTGEYDGEEPLPRVAELWRRGASVRAVSPPPPDLVDWGILALEAPPRVEAGAPLRVVAHLFRTGGGEEADASLRLAILDGDGPRDLRIPLRPPPDAGSWRQAVDLGPAAFGHTEVRALVVSAAGPDPVPENDRARTSTVAEGELVVGVVAGEASLPAARRWLAPSGGSALPGLQLRFAPLHELARILPDLDALVTFDVPLHSLDRGLVETFVRGGGGWLATQGRVFLNDYHWERDEDPPGLHRLLPLAPAPPEQGPRDVVLLMDGSGSMAGEPFAILRAASVDLVGAALPTDEVSLRFFTSALGPARVIKDRQRRDQAAIDEAAEAARRLLNARVPGGITFLLASLEQFAAERAKMDRECLTLFLSDGMERDSILDAHYAERVAALRESLAASRTELVVIGVGEELDEETLSLFTRPGEPLVRASGLEDLRAIFHREIVGDRLDRDAPLTVHVAPLPPAGVRSVARDAQGGAAGSPPPPLAVAVRSRLRPGAEAVWSGDEGEPYLAVQRVGRGRTAELATCPFDPWAPGWAGRAGMGEPRDFGPLLRWLARSDDPGLDEGPTARVEGDRLVVEGLPVDGPPTVEARLVASGEGWRSAGTEGGLAVTLGPPAGRPGIDLRRRREARLPAGFRRALGSRFLTLVVGAAGREGRLLALDVGLIPEFTPGNPRISLADPRGEEARPTAPGGLEGGRRAHPAAPGVLLVGLLVFVLAVFGKRLADRAIKAEGVSTDR